MNSILNGIQFNSISLKFPNGLLGKFFLRKKPLASTLSTPFFQKKLEKKPELIRTTNQPPPTTNQPPATTNHQQPKPPTDPQPPPSFDLSHSHSHISQEHRSEPPTHSAASRPVSSPSQQCRNPSRRRRSSVVPAKSSLASASSSTQLSQLCLWLRLSLRLFAFPPSQPSLWSSEGE